MIALGREPQVAKWQFEGAPGEPRKAGEGLQGIARVLPGRLPIATINGPGIRPVKQVQNLSCRGCRGCHFLGCR